ncbi:MAG: ABC transporter ATP-binding protein, partial [Flavobacteriales bacterium]
SSGKAFEWGIFARLYGRSKPYKWSFFITAFLVILIALLSPVRPEQLRIIIDEQVPQGNYDGVIKYTLWFIAFIVFEAILQYYQTMLANRVAQSITLDLRAELYKHVLRFKLSYFDRTPVGQFVTRLIGDIDGVAEVFSVGLLDIGRDILKLVVIIGFMFYLDWKMALIVMIPIPILIYATRIFQRAVKRSFNDVRNEVSRINVFIQEHVTGMSIVQIFNRQKREQEKFDQINKEHRNAHIRGIWAYSVFFPLVELLSAASVSLMIWWGLHESFGGKMTPGLLLEFSTFITMMYRPIRQMADNFNVLQMGVVNAERVFKVFDTDEKPVDTGDYDGEIIGDISFKNVWFAYQDENWVLRNINLDIQRGQTVAFVGATGAGKSSLAGLLNRFYDYNAGEISIDGKKLGEYKIDALRSQIGLVLQDVYLFNDSIMNNIRLYQEHITDEEIIEASKFIGTDQFISKLPGGYDFVVGERGAKLSVGQRQLISFVRAYVQKPSILVLDEATSSVDTESEILIQQATSKLTQGRTSIVIAHRLSTIRQADLIVVLEKGEIIEQGTHDELLVLGGAYKRLFELQFQTETFN